MIQHSVVEEVKRLLSEGKLSQRKIAKHIGISRATVGAIASGRRPAYQQRPPSEDDLFQSSGPPRRCHGCGGLVYLPCRLCHVRGIKRNDQRRARHRALMSAGRFEELNRPPPGPFTSTSSLASPLAVPVESRPPRDTKQR